LSLFLVLLDHLVVVFIQEQGIFGVPVTVLRDEDRDYCGPHTVDRDGSEPFEHQQEENKEKDYQMGP